MHTEWQQKIELAQQVYLPEYQRIVRELLGEVETFERLFYVFNRAFPGVAPIAKRSHPEQILKGRVTCDTSALLVALWYQLVKKIDLVVLVVQNTTRDIEPHRCLGLPTAEAATQLHDKHLIDSTYDTQVRTRPNGDEPIIWVHWKQALGLNYLKYENRTEIDTSGSWLMRSIVLSPEALSKLIISQSKPEKTKILLSKKAMRQERAPIL